VKTKVLLLINCYYQHNTLHITYMYVLHYIIHSYNNKYSVSQYIVIHAQTII